MAPKIWIDMDNSPHVPLFAPIVGELRRRGYPVLLTGRDAFQVKELVELFHLDCRIIGHHYGRHTLLKVAGTLYRALQLVAAVRRERPLLAVSHGSRSQVLASAVLGIPSVVMYDYEFARHLRLVRATWVLVPDVVGSSEGRNASARVLRYPGIKEDVYLPGFRPDPSIRKELGLREDEIVVTARPPADEAHYYNPESDVLFTAAVELLLDRPDTRIVVLPRTDRQAAELRQRWPAAFGEGRILIPPRVVDGLNLIWFSDLVISGGGTMNREAAALGVPVYSVFRGKIGAVDQYLARQGRLTLLESVDDVGSKVAVQRRIRPASPAHANGQVLTSIVDQLTRIADAAGVQP